MNNMISKFPHPRYIHKIRKADFQQAMHTKDVIINRFGDKPVKDSTDNLYEINVETRMHAIYTEIENFSKYELSNAIAYEMALRNVKVKEILDHAESNSKYPPRLNTNRDTKDIARKEYCLSIDDVLYFEAIGKVRRSQEENNAFNIKSIAPRYSRPILNPSSCTEATSMLPLQINFGVEESQVHALFDELAKQYSKYLKGHEDFWEVTNIGNDLLKSQPKILSTASRVEKIDKEAALLLLKEKVKVPNKLLEISIANMFFAYDMRKKFNASYTLIADTIKLYHIHLLQESNPEINQGKLDIIASRPDPSKTVKPWVESMSKFIEDCKYKQLISFST